MGGRNNGLNAIASRRRKGTAAGLAALSGTLWPALARAESVAGWNPTQRQYEIISAVPVVVLVAALVFTLWIDPYIRRRDRRIMQVIIALVFSLILQNYVEYCLSNGEPRVFLRTLVSMYGYIVRPVILVLFLSIIRPSHSYGWAWAMVGANAAVYATALFCPLSFWIDSTNHFKAGPLRNACLLVSVVLLAYLFYATARVFQPAKRLETWIPLFVVLIIIGSILLDYRIPSEYNQPVSFLTIAVVISCVFYYVWLHLQFVREHEKTMAAGQRVQLALSQIKPHFLYNTLATIGELCDSDAKGAKDATILFSRYLRGNMDAIDQMDAIPFSRELQHTKLYLQIEQMRFEDDLQVRYDIACTEFDIPALTVEPLVENAVLHGIREKPDGRGTVTLSTRETPQHYEVSVTDDGPGFDPAQRPEDGWTHVGIRNVQERLARVCGGRLKIDSEPGRGTTVTILLPKRQGARGC